MWAQNTLPEGDPLWCMNVFFRSDGGNNHANFSNVDVDNALDELSLAENHQERIDKSAIAHNLIVEQVPVSNLVTPLWHVGLSVCTYKVVHNDVMSLSVLYDWCDE